MDQSNSTKETLLGIIKTLSFLGSALIAASLVISSASKSVSLTLPINSLSTPEGSTIASIPLKQINFPDIGKVATPHIDTIIIGDNNQGIPTTFLVDSGAKISALPLSYIDQVGLNRDTAKRIYLRSATNNTTYGYLSNI